MDNLQQEPLRQRYLAAMGITPWLPKRPLPGAAPSPAWVWQAPESEPEPKVAAPAPTALARATNAPQHVSESRPSASTAPVRKRLDVKSLIGGVADATEVKNPPVAPEAATDSDGDASVREAARAGASKAAEIPQFRILLVHYEDCLVVNDLPLDPQQTVTPQHLSLLSAILASVGLGQGEPRQHTVTWPLFAANSGHDQGPEVARMMLHEESALEQQPSSLPIILLGEQSGRYLLSEGHGYSRVVCGPSLNQMLRVPSCKRELWLALQPLLSR